MSSIRSTKSYSIVAGRAYKQSLVRQQTDLMGASGLCRLTIDIVGRSDGKVYSVFPLPEAKAGNNYYYKSGTNVLVSPNTEYVDYFCNWASNSTSNTFQWKASGTFNLLGLFLPTQTGNVVNPNLDSRLTDYFTFENFSGGKFINSKSSNHLTPYLFTTKSGLIGSSGAYTDSKSSYLLLDNPIGGTGLTISLWYRSENGVGTYRSLIGQNGDSYTHLGVPNNNYLGWANNAWYTTSVYINDGEWNHFAMCRSGTRERIFFNGIFVADVTSFDYSPRPVKMFGNYKVGGADGCVGVIDDIRIFSGTFLSDDDIYDIYMLRTQSGETTVRNRSIRSVVDSFDSISTGWKDALIYSESPFPIITNKNPHQASIIYFSGYASGYKFPTGYYYTTGIGGFPEYDNFCYEGSFTITRQDFRTGIWEKFDYFPSGFGEAFIFTGMKYPWVTGFTNPTYYGWVASFEDRASGELLPTTFPASGDLYYRRFRSVRQDWNFTTVQNPSLTSDFENISGDGFQFSTSGLYQSTIGCGVSFFYSQRDRFMASSFEQYADGMGFSLLPIDQINFSGDTASFKILPSG